MGGRGGREREGWMRIREGSSVGLHRQVPNSFIYEQFPSLPPVDALLWR